MDRPKKGVYVDLRLGNLCNLKCRMCNPASNPMGRRMESKHHTTDQIYPKKNVID